MTVLKILGNSQRHIPKPTILLKISDQPQILIKAKTKSRYFTDAELLTYRYTHSTENEGILNGRLFCTVAFFFYEQRRNQNLHKHPR